MSKQEYQFLYWNTHIRSEANMKEYVVKAKSLKKAGKKFLNRRNAHKVKSVDYEVMVGDDYLDITDLKGFKDVYF